MLVACVACSEPEAPSVEHLALPSVGPSGFTLVSPRDDEEPERLPSNLGRSDADLAATRAEVATLREKMFGKPQKAEPAPTVTETSLAAAASMRPDDPIRAVVQLDDTFDFSPLASAASEAQLQADINARIAAIDPAQRALRTRLAAVGGRDMQGFWIVNQVAVTLPAKELAAIATWDGVAAITLDSTDGGGGLAYGGDQARDGMLTTSYGFNGAFWTRTGTGLGSQRIGILEWSPDPFMNANNWPARNHVGWLDTAGGSSRIIAQYDCRTGTCVTSTASASVLTHGTIVGWAALGSIDEGQDPAFPGSQTQDQRNRSMAAREAELYYYNVSSCSNLVVGLQKALSDGVDIVNFSGWTNNQTCTASADCSGLNAAIRNAANSGMLFTGCAGNSGPNNGTCNLWYPGYRPHVLSVNGLNTSNSASDYNSLTLATGASSTGGLAMTTVDGFAVSGSGVGLCAPGVYNYHFTTGTANYNLAGAQTGCSYATPTIAGVAALLREALRNQGFPGANAYTLMVNMFVLGDTWDYGDGSDRKTIVATTSGFGRIHLHRPNSANLTSPWAWGTDSFVIHDGETVDWPVGSTGSESPSITQWKWAFLWNEDNLASVADIVIKVVDKCPAGGGEVVVAQDLSYDLRKRIHLKTADISGKCLFMRAIGLSVPSGGRTVYTADYYHSGDPALH